MCESNGDPHVLDELLSDSNCNVNAYDAKGYAMIHRAASFGYSACIDMLIRYGADINLKTLVMLLSLCYCSRILRWRKWQRMLDLMERRIGWKWRANCAMWVLIAQVTEQDFFDAIMNNDVKEVEKLMSNPECFLFRNRHGMNGLHIACMTNSVGLCASPLLL
mgnify:FL=1